MLSFLLLKHGVAPGDGTPGHAHLAGAEGLPVTAEIICEGGLIRCEKPNTEAAALSVQVDLGAATLEAIGGPAELCRDPRQWSADGSAAPADEPADEARIAPGSPPLLPDGLAPLGTLTLQTCLLPDRDRPYLLSLELARHRIMLFYNKLEEWGLFDLPSSDHAMRLFEAARAWFSSALVAGRSNDHRGYEDQTHLAALRALWLGIEASERLAIADARANFAPRASGRIFAEAMESSPMGPATGKRQPSAIITPERTGVVLADKPYVGVAVSPDAFQETTQRTVADTAEFIQVPTRWIELEPVEGSYNFKKTDRWIEWSVRHAKRTVTAGPIIDFRPRCVPDWLFIWENDYDTLRDLVREHVKAVVTRYRKTVPRWIIASGLHVNDYFRLSFDQMMDLTKESVALVRKLHPNARCLVELTHPWGEYYTHNRKSVPPLLYAEMLSQAGIQIDGFGLRVQMGQPRAGQSVRDLMAFSDLLDRYAGLERPISLTAVGCPSAPPNIANHNNGTDADTPIPGDLTEPAPADSTAPNNAPKGAPLPQDGWHGPWTPARQADWLTAYVSVALAKPYVQSVTWHELVDSNNPVEMPSGGLVDQNGSTKPAAAHMAELKNALAAATRPQNLDPDALLASDTQQPHRKVSTPTEHTP